MLQRILLTLVCLTSSLQAASFANTFSIVAEIPDNDLVGFSDTQTISVPEIAEITEIKIGLTLSGGWLGDLYGFVQHDSGFSVLLNRVGRDSGDSLGSSAGSLDVTFIQGGADIHVADAPFTGLFGPDARETDPAFVLDSDPRTAGLDSFIGLPASGDWTLFLADLGAGDIATIESWSLTLQGVPEPGSAAAFVGLAASLLVLSRRRRL